MNWAGEAHARNGDPRTSHAAARAVTPRTGSVRERVEAFARSAGPDGFVLPELDAAMMTDDERARGGTSTYRTRCSELVAINVVIDSRRERKSGSSPRDRIIWVHRDFVPDPLPRLAAPRAAPRRDVLRGEAHAKAATLRTLAARLRGSYGLGEAARELEATADLLVKLVR